MKYQTEKKLLDKSIFYFSSFKKMITFYFTFLLLYLHH